MRELGVIRNDPQTSIDGAFEKGAMSWIREGRDVHASRKKRLMQEIDQELLAGRLSNQQHTRQTVGLKQMRQMASQVGCRR